MMASHRLARLEFTSDFDMLDLVQVVSDHIGRGIGLDDDAVHWVGVAIRESVINAIKHGNQHDRGKHVIVEFEAANDRQAGQGALLIRVRDQGDGFDPGTVGNPLAPENILKASGRGIFLIRNFMDDVEMCRAPEGGMEIRMTKCVPPGD